MSNIKPTVDVASTLSGFSKREREALKQLRKKLCASGGTDGGFVEMGGQKQQSKGRLRAGGPCQSSNGLLRAQQATEFHLMPDSYQFPR